MDATNFYLVFYLPESNEIEFKLFVDDDPEAPTPNTRMELGGGITDWIISNKQPLLLRENILEQMEEIGIEARGSESASYLGVPMLVGNKVIGMMAVQNYTNPLAYSSHHLDLLSSISNQATVAIENARLFHQEQKRAEQERLVRTITDKVRRGGDAQSIMRIALEELGQILEADASTIHLGTKEQLLNPPSSGNKKLQGKPETSQDE
jgi:transcriptional regulator with GAF, ATPase, and Fis domain